MGVGAQPCWPLPNPTARTGRACVSARLRRGCKMVQSIIGRPIGRVEGSDKVTGQARYSADVRLPGTLWGAVLRSPLPHARIVRIDTARARGLRGVHALLTGHDLGGRRYGRSIADVPILAHDRVRYVGDPVVAVAAAD